MLTFFGCHGTTRSRALSIVNSGFRPSDFGFWGAGVYFFHETKNGIQDACSWHKWALTGKNSPYRRDQDPNGAAVCATIKVQQVHHLDASSEAFQQQLERAEESLPSDPSPDYLNNLRDALIRLYEAELGFSVKVCTASIPLPGRGKYFRPRDAACCIIVKDVSCILKPYRVENCHE